MRYFNTFLEESWKDIHSISDKIGSTVFFWPEIRDLRGWTMPRGGRPHASWMRQVECYLKDTGMAAWRLPGRWPDGGRRNTVARWTRRRAAPAYAPIPDLQYPIPIPSSWMSSLISVRQLLRNKPWRASVLWNCVTHCYHRHLHPVPFHRKTMR